jgi:hypothetical protein
MKNKVDENGDFIFRFKLDEIQDEKVYDDPLTEMVRSQLAALLDVVVLTENDKPVNVNGFKFINDLDTVNSIFPK